MTELDCGFNLCKVLGVTSVENVAQHATEQFVMQRTKQGGLINYSSCIANAVAAVYTVEITLIC